MAIVPLGFLWWLLIGSLWMLLLVDAAPAGETKKLKTTKKEQQPKAKKKKKKSKSMAVPKSRLQVLQAYWEQNNDWLCFPYSCVPHHNGGQDQVYCSENVLCDGTDSVWLDDYTTLCAS